MCAFPPPPPRASASTPYHRQPPIPAPRTRAKYSRVSAPPPFRPYCPNIMVRTSPSLPPNPSRKEWAGNSRPFSQREHQRASLGPIPHLRPRPRSTPPLAISPRARWAMCSTPERESRP
eukprot:scaffold1054_cov116-Isochrysis_galbana.AAC.17